VADLSHSEDARGLGRRVWRRCPPQKLFVCVGRGVFAPDGSAEFASNRQPFLRSDPSVFDAVCAALRS